MLSTSKWEKSVKQTKMGRRKKALREWGSAKMRRRIITSKINSNWILTSEALKNSIPEKIAIHFHRWKSARLRLTTTHL